MSVTDCSGCFIFGHLDLGFVFVSHFEIVVSHFDFGWFSFMFFIFFVGKSTYLWKNGVSFLLLDYVTV